MKTTAGTIIVILLLYYSIEDCFTVKVVQGCGPLFSYLIKYVKYVNIMCTMIKWSKRGHCNPITH